MSRRAELAGRVRELRAAGLYHREVAEALGISRSYAAELAVDPKGLGNRVRHERARLRCVDCGSLMSWPGTTSAAEPRCPGCRRARCQPCGSRSAYVRGCRCLPCRAANAAYARVRYQQFKRNVRASVGMAR